MVSTSSATITMQAVIPRFTPASGCFSDIWQDCVSSSTCISFLIGSRDNYDIITNVCMTATAGTSFLPGTACPLSYTNVEPTERDSLNGAVTYRQFTCCPSLFGFTYEPSSHQTSVATFRQCTATSPSFPGPAPWHISIADKAQPTPSTAVFDPRRNLLVAPPVFMSYVVQDGTSCAPNCQSPYTGGPYPPPTPTSTAAACSNAECKGWKEVGVLVVTLPVVFVVVIVATCLWCCISMKRRARESALRGSGRTVGLATLPAN